MEESVLINENDDNISDHDYTSDFWNIGTSDLWNIGTSDLWNIGTSDLWNIGTSDFWNIGTENSYAHSSNSWSSYDDYGPVLQRESSEKWRHPRRAGSFAIFSSVSPVFSTLSSIQTGKPHATYMPSSETSDCKRGKNFIKVSFFMKFKGYKRLSGIMK